MSSTFFDLEGSSSGRRLYMALWRWIVGIETCRRHKNMKTKKISLENVYFFGFYCIIILHCMAKLNGLQYVYIHNADIH